MTRAGYMRLQPGTQTVTAWIHAHAHARAHAHTRAHAHAHECTRMCTCLQAAGFRLGRAVSTTTGQSGGPLRCFPGGVAVSRVVGGGGGGGGGGGSSVLVVG